MWTLTVMRPRITRGFPVPGIMRGIVATDEYRFPCTRCRASKTDGYLRTIVGGDDVL